MIRRCERPFSPRTPEWSLYKTLHEWQQQQRGRLVASGAAFLYHLQETNPQKRLGDTRKEVDLAMPELRAISQSRGLEASLEA